MFGVPTFHYRCSICDINYPVEPRPDCCKVCGSDMRWKHGAPHQDWEERVKILQTPDPSLDEGEKVLMWRTHQLFQAGWPPAHAYGLAQDRTIDLHIACAAIGCGDVELALDLLSL